MAWLYLFLAGLCEIGFATCLKLTDGFTRFWPSVGFVVLLTASMGLLTLAARTIPIGTAYAVWTGIGAAGIVVVGIVWFHEPATGLRILFLALLIGSVVGLKLVTPNPTTTTGLPPPAPPGYGSAPPGERGAEGRA
jgi:quaternary ammonium compound-resistance protein SugE